MPKWTPAIISDSARLTWEAFSAKYPGFCGYNAWRRQRYDVMKGRTSGGDEAVPRSAPIGDAPSPDTIDAAPLDASDLVEPLRDLAAPAQPDYEVKADGNVFINRSTRTIVTSLGEFGTVVFSFERHAAMRRRYAADWENSAETIPEIARDFDLHPKAFEKYKSMHGWTHASDPFTDEEWEEGLSVEDAVEQTLESHRRAFHKKLQKEKWARLIADAEKWRRFEQSALEPMLEAICAQAPSYRPPTVAMSSVGARPFDIVLCAPDLHYGKEGWADEVGEGYTRDQARQLLISKTEQLLSAVTMYGRPRKIITAVAGDWFHIDNDQGATTAGTPQDIDGTPHMILWEGSELAIAQIDMLRQVAPVEVYYCAGNHDRLLGWGLLYAVYAWFNQAEDVTIRRSAAPRQYAISGQTLIGFAHGDGARPKDMPLLMATEAAAQWGQTRHRAWFTGHLHFELTRDTMGVIQYQMPSLSGSDRWHTRSGYIGSRRSLAAYVVDATEGVVATIYAPVLASS